MSTALRTRPIVRGVPGFPAHLIDLRIHAHPSQNTPNGIDRVLMGSRLASHEHAIACLELQHLPWTQPQLFPKRLGDRHLSLFGDDALHTDIVGIPTTPVKPRPMTSAAELALAKGRIHAGLGQRRRSGIGGCASATGARAHDRATRPATAKTFPVLLTAADSTAASGSAPCPAPAPRATRAPSGRPATGRAATCGRSEPRPGRL